MTLEELSRTYLPMSESAFYILLSLTDARHGYGIIQHVRAMSRERVRLGAGTIYGTLDRFESDGLIVPAGEQDRRKLYALTTRGRDVLALEIERLQELIGNARLYGEVQ